VVLQLEASARSRKFPIVKIQHVMKCYKLSTMKNKYIVTDFIKALLGNGSVNTSQHATIKEEAVLSMWSAPSNNRNWVLCDLLLGYATVLTIEEVFSV
jgi:7-cyano-7-deazaguanine synthase in queuosine biosynthesis